MIRTQIQLPDDLYREAKAFCGEREMTMAELCRRSLEDYLARWPSPRSAEWVLPALQLGEFLAPESQWRDLANESE